MNKAKKNRKNMGKVEKGGKLKKYSLEIVFLLVVVAAVIPIGISIAKNVGNKADKNVTRVEVSMEGFSPATIRAKAGQEISIQLLNPDDSGHTDGGGKHQFASDELGLNYIVQPESVKVIKFKVDKPGTYTFYCDVCCGGKENPNMRGKLIIT